MELTKTQLDTLRMYKEVPDDDNVRIKDIAKKSLITDPLILYLLDPEKFVDDDIPAENYIGENILGNYLIHPTQHNVSNFICLGTEFFDAPRYNEDVKIQRIVFYILCEEKTNREKLTGQCRHDLISARVKDMFNWSNKFGTQCVLIDDRESVTDNDYATRTLIFEMETHKNLVKTRDGASRIVNKVG